MAVTSLKSPWRNQDGMNVYWPQDAGTVTRGGEHDYDGRHETFVEIDLTTLETVASGNVQIVAENVSLPKGAFIEDAVILVTKGAVGATATLDIGLVDLADRTTEIDFNGLVAAATVASLSATGDYVKYNVGSTGAGALIGTSIAKAGLFVAKPGTANFTTGKVQFRVRWQMLNSADV